MAEEPKKIRGVYEHPKGSRVFWIQYFEKGRRHRERVGTQAHALKLYQKRKTQIMLGEKLPELQRKRFTFGELLDCGVAYAREHNKTASQYAQKAEMLRPAFGARLAEDVQAPELAAWIRARGISGSSFNRYRAFLSLCYREAMRDHKVKANTAREIAQKREPRGRQRFLSRPEYDQVLAIIRRRTPEHETAFIFSVHTGARLSEQYGLLWKHVDLDHNQLTLVDTKNGEDRTVPLTSVVAEKLAAIKPKPARGPVFPRPRGGSGAIKPRWFNEGVIGEAALEEYSWHNNRHTFCSWLAIAGVPLKTIQELAGHKTISITARYAHLSPDHKKAEIEKLVLAPPAVATEIKALPFPTATKTARRKKA